MRLTRLDQPRIARLSFSDDVSTSSLRNHKSLCVVSRIEYKAVLAQRFPCKPIPRLYGKHPFHIVIVGNPYDVSFQLASHEDLRFPDDIRIREDQWNFLSI
jgi:hypothetical protein